MVGMNADALFRVSVGLMHFFERVGAAIVELTSFVSAEPPMDANGKVRSCYVSARGNGCTSNLCLSVLLTLCRAVALWYVPMLCTGNQMSVEEYKAMRRLKLLRWLVGFSVVFVVRGLYMAACSAHVDLQ